ncbi:hypothetical protein TNCV_2263951 [Trichonephila clavipes]|nr:hypothetical protein TNCV_2263951 [Trichonephila clavipes]
MDENEFQVLSKSKYAYYRFRGETWTHLLRELPSIGHSSSGNVDVPNANLPAYGVTVIIFVEVREAICHRTRNFEPLSSDEDDTRNVTLLCKLPHYANVRNLI